MAIPDRPGLGLTLEERALEAAIRPLSRAMPATPILILPGYGDSGDEHWQSHWERSDPACRASCRSDWLEPQRDDWTAALERAVGACAAPPVLAAHSLGCALVAHWASRTRWSAKGGLLVRPRTSTRRPTRRRKSELQPDADGAPVLPERRRREH